MPKIFLFKLLNLNEGFKTKFLEKDKIINEMRLPKGMKILPKEERTVEETIDGKKVLKEIKAN